MFFAGGIVIAAIIGIREDNKKTRVLRELARETLAVFDLHDKEQEAANNVINELLSTVDTLKQQLDEAKQLRK